MNLHGLSEPAFYREGRLAGHMPWMLRNRYIAAVSNRSRGKQPFRTSKGYIGLGPIASQKGDIIALLAGAQVPFVLRPDGSGAFSLVGEAYVHGIMDGEAAGKDAWTETFTLR